MNPTLTDTKLTDGGLYRLMTWLSPAFPVGSYAYSHGVERAVEMGQVRDETSLLDWVEGVIDFGAGRIDAILFAHAWRGEDVSELARAFRGTAELALETQSQGEAFAKAVQGVTVAPASYPLVVARAAAEAEIPLEDALVAYLQAFGSNLVSAGVRLIPLGQLAGQRVLDALRPTVLAAAQAALTRPLDRLGGAALAVDLASIQHETQYTRMFRS
jgi:urease accessory protein